MKMKSTINYPVFPYYYYVLYYRSNITKPKLLTIYFTSKSVAEYTLKLKTKTVHKYKYQIVRGYDIKDEFYYYSDKRIKLGKERRYIYPRSCKTHREKKYYRGRIKRRLRRMGIYFKIRTKGYVYDKDYDYQPEFIKNRQKLSQYTGKSIAKAFKLLRTGDRLIFVVLKVFKTRNEKEKVMFHCRVLKVNIETGKYKIIKLRVRFYDAIIPYLLTEFHQEILHLENSDEIMLFLNEKGIDFKRPRLGKLLTYNQRLWNKKQG